MGYLWLEGPYIKEGSLEGDKILVKSGLIRWVTFGRRGLILKRGGLS
jgi:hypothetical protein